MHQPLHCEDGGDKGGNTRHVVLDGHDDNLHWVWDTGSIEHINRDPETLAAELERSITPQERSEWEKGAIEDWVLEGRWLNRYHMIPFEVACGDRATPRSSARF
jgi:S1/P1 Nuclease